MSLYKMGIEMLKYGVIEKLPMQITEAYDEGDVYLYYHSTYWYLVESGLVIWQCYESILPFLAWLCMVEKEGSMIWHEKYADFSLIKVKNTDYSIFRITPKEDYDLKYEAMVSVSKLMEDIKKDLGMILSMHGMYIACKREMDNIKYIYEANMKEKWQELVRFYQTETDPQKLLKIDMDAESMISYLKEANFLCKDSWLSISDKEYSLKDVFSIYEKMESKE